MLVRSADRLEQVVAGLLTAAAHLGANAAVLVVLGVPLALFATGTARHHAALNRCTDDAGVGRCLAGHDAAGGVAQIGAVEAKANAAHHLLYVVHREIRVGTTRAAGGAVEALFDTAQERALIDTCRLWMCLDYVANRHVLAPHCMSGDGGMREHPRHRELRQ